jgi:hypothetical protein
MAGPTLARIVEELKPEAVYFTEQDGHQEQCSCSMLKRFRKFRRWPSRGFLNFNADCKFRIAMTPEDLRQAGLEELAKKWG